LSKTALSKLTLRARIGDLLITWEGDMFRRTPHLDALDAKRGLAQGGLMGREDADEVSDDEHDAVLSPTNVEQGVREHREDEETPVAGFVL
jgi:hypothetical protein